MIVDAHVHVACPDAARYPRNLTGVGSEWWRAGGGPDALEAVLDAHGVARAVVVQAVGLYGYDCRCAADVVAGRPDRFALVVAVDMHGPDPAAALSDLLPLAPAGVRVFGVAGDSTAWLTDGRAAAVWDAAAEAGVTVVPTLYARDLHHLRALVDARPAVPVALDHCGFPDLGGPGAEDELLSLRDLPPLHVKVTSHNLEAADDPAAFVERLVAAFGPDRVCWGSDHPQHQTLPYPTMLQLARRAASQLPPEHRHAFFAGNSLRLWWRE